MTLWDNKLKLALLIMAVAIGPELYAEWKTERDQKALIAERKAVDTDASITGIMLASAWKSCKNIGILNNMEGCAAYQGKLLQEIAAPALAKMAIEHRDSYYRTCQKFESAEYCGNLLARSLQLSIAQQESGK